MRPHPHDTQQARLVALRAACHDGERGAVARLLAEAPADTLAWSYAAQHGMVTPDWERVDRQRFVFLPGAEAWVVCARCSGQGRLDPGSGARVRCGACWGSGAAKRPGPPLWVSRRQVTRATWLEVVGEFSEAYQRWLKLAQNRNRWPLGTRAVCDASGVVRQIVAADRPMELGGQESFRFCNALTRAELGDEHACYVLEPSERPGVKVERHLHPDGLCTTFLPGRRGYRLLSAHEWASARALGLLSGGEGLEHDLCWSHNKRIGSLEGAGPRAVVLLSASAARCLEYELPASSFTRSMSGLRVAREAEQAPH